MGNSLLSGILLTETQCPSPWPLPCRSCSMYQKNGDQERCGHQAFFEIEMCYIESDSIQHCSLLSGSLNFHICIYFSINVCVIYSINLTWWTWNETAHINIQHSAWYRLSTKITDSCCLEYSNLFTPIITLLDAYSDQSKVKTELVPSLPKAGQYALLVSIWDGPTHGTLAFSMLFGYKKECFVLVFSCLSPSPLLFLRGFCLFLLSHRSDWNRCERARPRLWGTASDVAVGCHLWNIFLSHGGESARPGLGGRPTQGRAAGRKAKLPVLLPPWLLLFL